MMENQVSEETVKDRFGRLLAAVQEIASEKSGRFTGTCQKILVETVNEQDDKLLTGRMSNNSVVHFKGDASLIGTIVDVALKECKGFYYMGELILHETEK